MKLLFRLFPLLLLIACDPADDFNPPITPVDTMEVDTIPCPNFDSDYFKVVWQQPLHPDTLFSLSMKPTLIADKIAYSDRLADNNENLQGFNKLTGEQLWITQDFVPNNQGIQSDYGRIEDQGNLSFSFVKELYSIDGDNGNILWHYRFDNGRPRAQIINHQIYFSETYDNLGAQTRAILYRSPVSSPQWETIYVRYIENDFRPGFESPSLYMNMNLDSILIFQNRSTNFITTDGQIDLLAYNLNTKQLEWEQLDITENGNSSVFPSIIKDGKIYFQGDNEMICYEAETGEEIWRRHFGYENFLFCSNLIFEDKLIINGSSNSISALNLETGVTIWENDDVGFSPDNMDHYEGYLYFGYGSNGKLHKLNGTTGELIYKAYPPNRLCADAASFAGGVTIDKETGYLYTHDKFFAICIDLKE